jgi:hypothetical protein
VLLQVPLQVLLQVLLNVLLQGRRAWPTVRGCSCTVAAVILRESDVVRPSELSSLASSIEDLTRRVTDAADQESGNGHDDVAAELFAVERALAEAGRRIRRLG